MLSGGIALQLLTPRVLRDFLDLALNGAVYEQLVRQAMVFFALVLVTQFTTTTRYLPERARRLDGNQSPAR